MTPAIVRVDHVSKTYHSGSVSVHALRDASLRIGAGEFIAVMGPSGSGKSTLLHLIAGLDLPSAGSIHVRDLCVSSMSDDEATAYRRKHVGVVYQSFNLFPDLTIEENVGVPLVLDGRSEREIRDRVGEMLSQLGLIERRTHKPSEVSGGEQQRAAIARALIAEPMIVLADEPTGNLDSYTGEQVLTDMRSIVERSRCTVVIVTHDHKAAAYADRIERLLDGKFVPRAEAE